MRYCLKFSQHTPTQENVKPAAIFASQRAIPNPIAAAETTAGE